MTAAKPDTAFQSLAPVLVVDRVEPCLDFWRDRLGFAEVARVPEGDAIGFAMLARDGVTVMYQSRESVRKDIPPLADAPSGGSVLYVNVASLDDVEARLEGVEKVVPRRTTFYGATEIGVREPGGNLVVFAEHASGGDESPS